MDNLRRATILLLKWRELAIRYGDRHPDIYTVSHLALIQSTVESLPDDDVGRILINLERWYQMDLQLATQTTPSQIALQSDLKSIQKTKKNWFLVTVGFNDEEIKGKETAILTTAHRKILDIAGMEFLAHSIEKHRKDKNKKIYIHHHIHYVVKTDYAKSKVIQFFFQKVSKLGVSTKNFIDVSQNGSIDTALKYVSGDKVDEKMECVALDIKWRQETGLDKI